MILLKRIFEEIKVTLDRFRPSFSSIQLFNVTSVTGNVNELTINAILKNLFSPYSFIIIGYFILKKKSRLADGGFFLNG